MWSSAGECSLEKDHFELPVESAGKILDFASRCNHTFTDLQRVYVDFGELLSRANDDELRFVIVQL